MSITTTTKKLDSLSKIELIAIIGSLQDSLQKEIAQLKAENEWLRENQEVPKFKKSLIIEKLEAERDKAIERLQTVEDKIAIRVTEHLLALARGAVDGYVKVKGWKHPLTDEDEEV